MDIFDGSHSLSYPFWSSSCLIAVQCHHALVGFESLWFVTSKMVDSSPSWLMMFSASLCSCPVPNQVISPKPRVLTTGSVLHWYSSLHRISSASRCGNTVAGLNLLFLSHCIYNGPRMEVLSWSPMWWLRVEQHRVSPMVTFLTYKWLGLLYHFLVDREISKGSTSVTFFTGSPVHVRVLWVQLKIISVNCNLAKKNKEPDNSELEADSQGLEWPGHLFSTFPTVFILYCLNYLTASKWLLSIQLSHLQSRQQGKR